MKIDLIHLRYKEKENSEYTKWSMCVLDIFIRQRVVSLPCNDATLYSWSSCLHALSHHRLARNPILNSLSCILYITPKQMIEESTYPINVYCVLIEDGIDKRFPQSYCTFLYFLWSLLLLAPFLFLQVRAVYLLNNFLWKSIWESCSHHWCFLWDRRGLIIMHLF